MWYLMNAPKLRFKEFTDGWKDKKLEDVVDFLDDRRKPIKDSDRNNIKGIYPYYGASGIIDYINDYIFDEELLLLGEDGANILSRSTQLVFKATGKYWVNNHAHVLSPKENYNIDFLESYLENINYEPYNTGTAQPKLNQEVCRKINIKTPSLKEQVKIGKTLSLLDKKIELQTRKIEALKLFKLYIIQNIFNEEKLNDFQSVTLEKILKPGSKIPVKNISKYEKMTVKLNFKGLAKLETKKEMADTRPFYVRNENEIIIGKQNYFNGSIAKVTKEFNGCICSNAIMSFTTINDVNVDYVLYYLSQKNYINRRKFLANGTGQKELSEKEFLKFVIKLPPTQIQNNISKKISCVNDLLLLENKKLIILNNLKKGLLQNLFV